MEKEEQFNDEVFIHTLSKNIEKRPDLAGKAMIAISNGIYNSSMILQGKINLIDLALSMKKEKTLNEIFSKMNKEELIKYGLDKYTK